VRTLSLLLFLLLEPFAPGSAAADVTYYSYNAIRDWNIPGGDTTVVFVLTLLFGATVWFVARGIWLRDRTAEKRNWMLGALTFVAAALLVFMHVQRS